MKNYNELFEKALSNEKEKTPPVNLDAAWKKFESKLASETLSSQNKNEKELSNSSTTSNTNTNTKLNFVKPIFSLLAVAASLVLAYLFVPQFLTTQKETSVSSNSKVEIPVKKIAQFEPQKKYQIKQTIAILHPNKTKVVLSESSKISITEVERTKEKGGKELSFHNYNLYEGKVAVKRDVPGVCEISVTAGALSFREIGTIYSVEKSDNRVTLEVTEGVVEIEQTLLGTKTLCEAPGRLIFDSRSGDLVLDEKKTDETEDRVLPEAKSVPDLAPIKKSVISQKRPSPNRLPSTYLLKNSCTWENNPSEIFLIDDKLQIYEKAESRLLFELKVPEQAKEIQYMAASSGVMGKMVALVDKDAYLFYKFGDGGWQSGKVATLSAPNLLCTKTGVVVIAGDGTIFKFSGTQKKIGSLPDGVLWDAHYNSKENHILVSLLASGIAIIDNSTLEIIQTIDTKGVAAGRVYSKNGKIYVDGLGANPREIVYQSGIYIFQ